MMKASKKLILAIISICLLITAAGCSTREDEPATAEVDLSGELKEVEAFGLVKAEESRDIIIDFPAIVSEVLVKEGQHVSMHDPILTLDSAQYESQLSNKKSELNIAKLEHQKVINSLEELSLGNNESEISKLKNELALLIKIKEHAAEQFNSNEKLYNEGAISKEAYDLSKQNMEEAINNAENIQYELQQAESNTMQFTLKLESEKNQSEIQSELISQIENNLADLERKLNKSYIMGTQIISDCENAAIYNIAYTSGDIIDTDKKAFSIANLDKLIVEADVVEEFIKDVREGSSVRIVPVADRTKEYKGIVSYISQMAFSKNGETVVPIKISIEDTDSFLLPNYNVDVFINVE